MCNDHTRLTKVSRLSNMYHFCWKHSESSGLALKKHHFSLCLSPAYLSLPHFFVFALQDMFLMAAMGPPGGGRTVISPRLQSRFNIINMTFPTVRPWGLWKGLSWAKPFLSHRMRD